MRGGFDERVYDTVVQTRWRHGRSERDEDIDLVVQLRMDGQPGESLGCALGEANIGERLLVGRAEDVVYAVRDVVEGKLINGEVPELV